jgi:hypothetical protein
MLNRLFDFFNQHRLQLIKTLVSGVGSNSEIPTSDDRIIAQAKDKNNQYLVIS